MKTTKIYQVQGNGNAHYVASTSKSKALKLAKEIWSNERITNATDWTSNFTEEELSDLPEYIVEA